VKRKGVPFGAPTKGSFIWKDIADFGYVFLLEKYYDW